MSNSVTDSDNNLRATFSLFFAPNSRYNEEDIEEVFYNALENRVSFDSGNVIVQDSFDLSRFTNHFPITSNCRNAKSTKLQTFLLLAAHFYTYATLRNSSNSNHIFHIKCFVLEILNPQEINILHPLVMV